MSVSNYIIDDSQWSTPFLALSPGWNMLNATSSQFISPSQVDLMRPLLPSFHGGSYSWNTHAGCSNTLTFVGTTITAYGMSGPESGEYSVVLDGEGRVLIAKAESVDYAHILFTVEGLEEKNHSLTFTNLVDGNWFGFDYAEISTIPASETEIKPQAAHPDTSTPISADTKNFNLPEGLLVPAHMLLSGQPTPEQLALLVPYKPHWTPGAYFVIFIAAVSLACLYVFFLFQFAGMLRDKVGEDTTLVRDKREELPRFNPPTGANRRYSWESDLKKAARGESGNMREVGEGDDGKQVSNKVKNALKLKQISGPSPIPEVHGINANKVEQLQASGSGTSHDDDDDEERGDTESMDGTWPRTPSSFPRLSTPSSPRHSPRGSPRGTPRGSAGERGMRGYF